MLHFLQKMQHSDRCLPGHVLSVFYFQHHSETVQKETCNPLLFHSKPYVKSTFRFYV